MLTAIPTSRPPRSDLPAHRKAPARNPPPRIAGFFFLGRVRRRLHHAPAASCAARLRLPLPRLPLPGPGALPPSSRSSITPPSTLVSYGSMNLFAGPAGSAPGHSLRSEEHTSELQSLMRISYAVFCLNKITIISDILSHNVYVSHKHTIRHNTSYCTL